MNVIIAINSTKSVPLAAGVTAGLFRFNLFLKDQSAPSPFTTDTADLTCTFADVPPGDYTAVALRIGSDGLPLSDLVSADVTVPVPVENADVPASITVSLG